jgi:hypothetical protein
MLPPYHCQPDPLSNRFAHRVNGTLTDLEPGRLRGLASAINLPGNASGFTQLRPCRHECFFLAITVLFMGLVRALLTHFIRGGNR